MTYLNPYATTNFFSFFVVLLRRIYQFCTGDLTSLAADEVQIIVLSAVAVSAALVGAFLILKRMAMLANSLSHTILVGIILAYLLIHGTSGEHFNEAIPVWQMLIASVITGLLTTFLTEALTRSLKLQADASNGLVFTTLFAAGVILTTIFTRNAHVGAEVIMGNVDGLHVKDIQLVVWILLGNLFLFTLFFKEFKITAFDPNYAKALGFSTAFFNYLLMLQVSATVIGAFRAVGVLMVLAFIVGPPLTARLLTQRLFPLLCISSFIGLLSVFIGVALSRHLYSTYLIALSTGALVVCCIVAIFLLTLLLRPKRQLIAIGN